MMVMTTLRFFMHVQETNITKWDIQNKSYINVSLFKMWAKGRRDILVCECLPNKQKDSP